MSEAPDVEVHIVKSNDALGGRRARSAAPLAPAMANAVFAATGTRVRRLPVRRQTVLEALKSEQ